MKKFMNIKVGIALLAATVAVVAGVVAYAYFTNSGTGAGTATVGTSSGIELSSALVGDLYPGGADVPVTVNISNPGSGAQHVGTISGSVTTQGSCLGAWFQVDSVVFNNTIAAGGTASADTNVRMTNTLTNQDACQGLTMAIVWSSN